MVRVRIPTSILKIAIWISLISVMSLSYQLIFSETNRSILPIETSLHDKIVKYQKSLPPKTKTQHVPVTTTLSPRMQYKLQTLQKLLNDSELVNKSMYPGARAEKFIMLDPNICRDAPIIDIITIVHTAPSHFGDRQRIRDSFGKKTSFFPFQVRVAFLLGITLDSKLESALMTEQSRHGDLVMGDFIDDYHNLTLKGVMGYHWVSKYCPNSKYVLKIDDDVLINMYKLLYSFMNHMYGKPRSIFCNVWYNLSMPILREGKWKVPSHMFSKFNLFPYDYCSGFVVIMTSDLMAPMYEAAKRTAFFWIDDIYLFGILPSVVGGVTYYNYPLNQNMTLVDKVAINCTRTLGTHCGIFATIISQAQYWNLWGMIQTLYTSKTWNAQKKLVV